MQIKNFLSYGSELQTINFNTYPLICLSGKNGHGKSALLDAITWAIWGQARKIGGTSKADQGLLRLGQTHMLVVLDFECNGQTYRVRREFTNVYGKPHSQVDFGMLELDTQKFIPLTDKTIKDTQAKIENTIHLDFDSFVNSAFLRQGQSNEFSKKSPKERKEILANILGLSKYESLRKKAHEKVRTLTAQKSGINLLQENIQAEIELLIPSLNEQQSISENIEQNATFIKQLEQKKVEFEKQQKALFLKQQTREQLIFKHAHTRDDYEKKLEQWKTLVSEWRTVNKKRSTSGTLSTLNQQKQELTALLRTQQEQWQKKLLITESLLKIKEQEQALKLSLTATHSRTFEKINAQIEHAHLEMRVTKKQYEQLEHSRVTLETEKVSLETRITHLQAQLSCSAHLENNAVEKQFEKRKEYYQQWIALGNATKANLDTVLHKSNLSDEDSPSCPLCEQNLSASRKRFIQNKLSVEELKLRNKLDRLYRTTKKLKARLIEQHAIYEQIKKDKNQRIVNSTQLHELEQQIIKINAALLTTSTDLETCKISLANLSKKTNDLENELARVKNQPYLENNEEYTRITKQLTCTQAELGALSYNEELHTDLQTQIANLDNEINTISNVLQNISAQSDRLEQISLYTSQLKKIKQHIQSITIELAAFDNLDLEQKKIAEGLEKLDSELHKLNNEKKELLVLFTKNTQLRERLAVLQQNTEKQREALSVIDAACYDYQAIALASSKDGIQALLIEDVLPEIESEANILLSRLTDNQTQIFIESLRDLKKGGTRETLDIKISDATGLRPYELFSGGEAFRIDFALRVSISKLLARRSGTALQTLIIDEGFGSQDEDGLQHIMDCLHAIQQDFAKIIIVSHLPTMKNQFPVHFIIEKGARGSEITVMEQG